jgi:hypothetical protein
MSRPGNRATSLTELLSTVKQFVSRYSQTFLPPNEHRQFAAHLATFDSVLTSIGSAATVSALQVTIGIFLKDHFCYLFNCWVRFVYVPIGRTFIRAIFDDQLIQTMTMVRTRNNKLWQAFWALSRWFLERARPGTLETLMKVAIANSESRANSDARRARREGRAEPFATHVLPRLREIDAVKKELELGHQTSDSIESFIAMSQELYNGPLPPCYRGGNFTLKYYLGQIVVETNNWTPEQLNDAFPTAPNVEPSRAPDFDCQDVKRWLRECFQSELQARIVQLRTEITERYRPEYPIPQGAFDRAACKRELQRMRKRSRHQLRAIQRNAEKEALRLQEEIQHLNRAQRRAERHSRAAETNEQQRRDTMDAEIDHKLQQLADMEQQTANEYQKYHGVLLRARSHIEAEAEVITQLKRKYGLPGGADEALELGLETGASLKVICDQLERDWQAIASV